MYYPIQFLLAKQRYPLIDPAWRPAPAIPVNYHSVYWLPRGESYVIVIKKRFGYKGTDVLYTFALIKALYKYISYDYSGGWYLAPPPDTQTLAPLKYKIDYFSS